MKLDNSQYYFYLYSIDAVLQNGEQKSARLKNLKVVNLLSNSQKNTVTKKLDLPHQDESQRLQHCINNNK